MNGRKPTRDFDALRITYSPPGVEKEKIRQRATVPLSVEYDHIPFVHEQWGGTYREEGPQGAPKRHTKTAKGRPYAELRASSAFSFLDGASLPEDLMHFAAERDLPAMALLDRSGVYGAPRFYSAAKVGARALMGGRGSRRRLSRQPPTGSRPRPSPPPGPDRRPALGASEPRRHLRRLPRQRAHQRRQPSRRRQPAAGIQSSHRDSASARAVHAAPRLLPSRAVSSSSI